MMILPTSQVCVPHLYCSVHYADLVISPTSTPCWLAINTPGICCYPTVPNVGKVINISNDCYLTQSQIAIVSSDRTSPASRDSPLLQVPGGV